MSSLDFLPLRDTYFKICSVQINLFESFKTLTGRVLSEKKRSVEPRISYLIKHSYPYFKKYVRLNYLVDRFTVRSVLDTKPAAGQNGFQADEYTLGWRYDKS